MAFTALIEPLKITQYDLQPPYKFKAEDADGLAIDITGDDIVCTMKTLGGTVKINRQAAGITITDGPNGLGQYAWQAGDTDTTGVYHIEFEITPTSGAGKFTLPQPHQGRAEVHVTSGQDAE